jgi:putative endonuclease
MYWVYILKCFDGGFYVGCTDNIRKRLEKHSCGYVNATKYRLPITLWQCHGFQNKYTAFNFEKYLKTASGRAFASKHFTENSVELP